MRADDAEALLDRWLAESAPAGGPASPREEDPEPGDHAAGREALALSPADRAALALAGVRRGRALEADAEAQQPGTTARRTAFDRFARCVALLKALLRRKTPLGEAGVRESIDWLADRGASREETYLLEFLPLAGIVKAAEDHLGDAPPPDGLRDLAATAADRLEACAAAGGWAKESCDKYAKRLRAIAARPPADESADEPAGDPAGDPARDTATLEPDGFTIAADDPLRAAQERLGDYLKEAAAAKFGRQPKGQGDEPKQFAVGRDLLAASAAERAALAAAIPARHGAVKRSHPGDPLKPRTPARALERLLEALLRKALPLDAAGLAAAAKLAGGGGYAVDYWAPFPWIVKQAERFAKNHDLHAPGDDVEAVRVALDRVAQRARRVDQSLSKTRKYADALDTLLRPPVPADPEPADPVPAVETVTLEPDGYELPADHPLRAAHERLSAFIAASRDREHQGLGWSSEAPVKRYPAGAAILKLPKAEQAAACAAIPERYRWQIEAGETKGQAEQSTLFLSPAGHLRCLLRDLLGRAQPLDPAGLAAVLGTFAPGCDGEVPRLGPHLFGGWRTPWAGFAKQAEAFVKNHGPDALTAELRDGLRAVAASARRFHSSTRPLTKHAARIEAALAEAAAAVPADPVPAVETVTLAPDGYELPADDPLRPHHDRLSEMLIVVRKAPSRTYHYGFEPKNDLPGAADVLALKKPEQAAFVRALCDRVRWWTRPEHAAEAREAYDGGDVEHDSEADRARNRWVERWAGPAQATLILLDRLLRRALPFDETDLLALAAFLTGPDGPARPREAWQFGITAHDPWLYGNPALGLSKQVAAFVKKHGGDALTPALREALHTVAAKARERDSSYAPIKKYAAALEELAGPADATAAPDPVEAAPAADWEEPAVSGPPVTLEPDDYLIAADDPLRPTQELFSQFLRDTDAHFGPPTEENADDYRLWWDWDPTTSEAGATLLNGAPADNAWVTVAGLRRIRHLADREAEERGRAADWQRSRYSNRLTDLFVSAYHRRDQTEVSGLLDGTGSIRGTARSFCHLLEALADTRADSHLTSLALKAVGGAQARTLLKDAPARTLAAAGRVAAWRRAFDHWHGDDGGTLRALTEAAEPHGPPVLDRGEAWSDAALDWLGKAMDRPAWEAWLRHCATAEAAKPSKKWAREAGTLLDAVGRDAARDALLDWFPKVDRPRTDPLPPALADRDRHILPRHADILKGLVWCAPLLAGQAPADLARSLSALAVSSYKKVPGVGPRLVKVGNAAVWALGELPGRDAVGQLALLAVKVKFGSARKQIDQALAAAADRAGLPRDEIDELAVPAYGLGNTGRVGVREEELGDFTARLTATGTSSTKLEFLKPDGKVQKSVPAALKRDFPDELKELKAAAKDIQKMLPAQRDRIDALFTANRTWDYTTWRERYADHPLIGTLARRLIWRFSPEGSTPEADDSVVAVPRSDALVDAHGEPVAVPGDAAVTLWHPAGEPVGDVLAWRRYFEELGEPQPFKQAHREVYLLTDAERNTRVYSNRFAAHLVKQHQFKALADQRGWKSPLRLMVDDAYPPATKELPAHGLRAEYWVEGAGDEYGTDTTESGSYLYLATDQVRFHRSGDESHHAHAGGGGYGGGAWGNDAAGEPVPLEEIPPLVLSEILRDADLFVGVAGVGADPNWADAGAAGAGGVRAAYADRWHDYSFGDLSATAKTRRDVLARLVPRLKKLSGRAEVGEKFLVVKGDRRTYKIHLGSGNILMEPNDQYLCIVPGSAARDPAGAALPFEGDRTLSVILSKALLLADDAKITDRTILSQL